ncbi:galactokinase [uncultured Chryseobacterium sp.]|uniref:galactokinase n=1 Tax=uncultured Chryseobacterium sp. TaxID=259322 RepID=UPI0025EDAB13|nr:galactokinase [uncultured Chryseobacterium sp.]
MQEKLMEATKDAFRKAFRSEPGQLFLAPGRINIIGEHVDYNDGFVLPAAIDKYICFAVTKKDDSDTCTVFAGDFDESFSFDTREKQVPGEKQWANYLLGVFNAVQESGKATGGMQIAFTSTIPMGSGLSSSAALECGFAYILDSLFGLSLSGREMAVIGQKAEHTFVGVNCGIMDQFASVFGKENKVIMLDCNSLSHQYHDAELEGYSWVLFDSCVKHTHLTSGYNERRKEVERGKAVLQERFPQAQTFRDFTLEMLEGCKEEMGNIPYIRCSYLIKEIGRVEKAVQALSENRPEELGRLMNETHSGLSGEYEVSCEEIDFLVEETLKQKGVLGARMMGGGFGGCSINLIKEDAVEEAITAVTEKYKNKFNIPMKVYPVKISDGIKEYKAHEYI